MKSFLTQLTLICNPRKFSTAELAFGHAEGVVISDLFVAAALTSQHVGKSDLFNPIELLTFSLCSDEVLNVLWVVPIHMYMSDFEPGLESSNRGFQCILELPELQKLYQNFYKLIIRVRLSDIARKNVLLSYKILLN